MVWRKRAIRPSGVSGSVRATARASRTCRAACCNSFLPPAAATTCASTGSEATVAAVLMEIVPDFTAASNSGVAAFWIFSICTMVLLLMRAALAIASRVSKACGRASTGEGAGTAGSDSSHGGEPSAATGAGLAAGAVRAARISFFRRANTPR